ncbi:MAG: NAD(P)/FAD-dependent oxidoreductase [Candidatus Acetothermia bacterium]|jgi:thioredoxin reductase|nr:NAD(P)/FAD-dependent oxidoreductase [Candidatus Acetothermia bacterium]MDH7505242.1 NAD(P)/FAD-dependent oxidoreductase [Candidatus Acetothermia bacterium]
MTKAEVVITGAGPAGLAAALQLKRSGLEPLLLERERVGGLLLNANLVENYPGFPGGIRGEELVRLFAEQLERVGVQVSFEEVRRLDHSGGAFLIETDERRLTAKVAVLASGTKPREFTDCPIPEEAKGRVFYEVYPLRELTGARIGVVGAGDAAFDYALNLASRGNEVHILNRSGRMRCLPLLWERARASPRIHYHENTMVTETKGSARGLRLGLISPGRSWPLELDYAIFAIGRVPQLDYLATGLRGRLAELEAGGLLYLVGDVRRGPFRQTAIAVGDGLETAMRIYQRLKEGQ